MKYLLLFCIKMYWYFWEEKERRNCIFEKSCSNYVYESANEKGFITGLKTLGVRFSKCRPGYEIFSDEGDIYVKLADGSTINEKMASSNIIVPYKETVKKFEESLNY